MDKAGFDNLKRILKGKDPKKKLQVGYAPTVGKKTDKPDGTRMVSGDNEYIAANGEWHKYSPGKIITYTDSDGNEQKVGGRSNNYSMPWFCPNCKKIMKGNKDRKSFYSNGTCLNCMVDYHHELRKAGKLDQFAFRKRLLSSISWYEEQISEFDDFVEKMAENPEFVFSDGRSEKWDNQLDIDKISKEYKEYLEEYKKKLDKGIEKYEKDYGESLNEWTGLE